MGEYRIASYARKQISCSLDHKSLTQNESVYEMEKESINILIYTAKNMVGFYAF